MFCMNCGKDMPAEARFCSNCGKAVEREPVETRQVETPSRDSEQNELVMEIRPRFIWTVQLVKVLPLALFFMVWGGGFFGGMFTVFFAKATNQEQGTFGFYPFLICGILFFSLVWGLGTLIPYFNTQKTCYKIYADRITKIDGFFNISEQHLKLHRIVETSYDATFIQRMFGLGNINLETLGSGFVLANIEDPRRIYDIIDEMVRVRKKSENID